MREPHGTEPARPDRLLVVVAHPGDAERAIGGSVARWVRAGTSAQLVCGTSGDASGLEPDADPLELTAAREAAQRAAADIIGYEDVTFLHRPEGALANDPATREQLVRCIRRFRPDTVATADPRVLLGEDGRISHIDQRELGTALLDALVAAARPMAFAGQVRSEGLASHVVTRALLFWSERTTTTVAVEDVLETKLAAVSAVAEASLADGSELVDEAFAVVELAGQR